MINIVHLSTIVTKVSLYSWRQLLPSPTIHQHTGNTGVQSDELSTGHQYHTPLLPSLRNHQRKRRQKDWKSQMQWMPTTKCCFPDIQLHIWAHSVKDPHKSKPDKTPKWKEEVGPRSPSLGWGAAGKERLLQYRAVFFRVQRLRSCPRSRRCSVLCTYKGKPHVLSGFEKQTKLYWEEKKSGEEGEGL